MIWMRMVLASLAISISEIQAQERWYYPGPRGLSIIPDTGVFNDAQTGYAVKNPNKFDTADAVQKTVDGGATWTINYETSEMHIFSLHFPDRNAGYAKGSSVLGNPDQDQAILIKYKFFPVSFLPGQKNLSRKRFGGPELISFGENVGRNVLGRLASKF